MDQTNSQISSISSMNTPKVQKRLLPRTGPITPVTVLLYKLTSHTTAVTPTSAGGMHRAESYPSRPSTLINLNSKLPPSAPNHARTVHNGFSIRNKSMPMRASEDIGEPAGAAAPTQLRARSAIGVADPLRNPHAWRM